MLSTPLHSPQQWDSLRCHRILPLPLTHSQARCQERWWSDLLSSIYLFTLIVLLNVNTTDLMEQAVYLKLQQQAKNCSSNNYLLVVFMFMQIVNIASTLSSKIYRTCILLWCCRQSQVRNLHNPITGRKYKWCRLQANSRNTGEETANYFVTPFTRVTDYKLSPVGMVHADILHTSQCPAMSTAV